MKIEDIHHIVDFYKKKGCIITFCETCKKILTWDYPDGPGVSGPSLSSGMFCQGHEFKWVTK